MPFPNEHAARQSDPGQYIRFRRSHPKEFPEGIDVIFGIKRDGKSEIQSFRFDKKKWTPEKAKEWLKEHKFKTEFEEAVEVKKSLWHGVL